MFAIGSRVIGIQPSRNSFCARHATTRRPRRVKLNSTTKTKAGTATATATIAVITITPAVTAQ